MAISPRLYPWLLVMSLLAGTICCSGAAHGQEPSFPWGCRACAPPAMPGLAIAPYQTLPKKQPTAAARAIHQLPAKTPYAYGWFGHNPHGHWHRQFGHSNAYTQWSFQ